MSRHLLGMLEPSVILQVNCDAGSPGVVPVKSSSGYGRSSQINALEQRLAACTSLSLQGQHAPGSIINPDGWRSAARSMVPPEFMLLGKPHPLIEDKAKGQKRQAPRPKPARSNVIDLVASRGNVGAA
jgi:hypothetical protein